MTTIFIITGLILGAVITTLGVLLGYKLAVNRKTMLTDTVKPVTPVLLPHTAQVEPPQPARFVEQPTAITLAPSDSNLPNLEFRRLASDNLSSYQPNSNDGSFAQLLSPLVTNALVAPGVLGTFKATVDTATLMQYGNGTFSSIVQGVDGPIKCHAGFAPVDAAKVFAPLVVFQVMGMVTGQYYLHGISKQLKTISASIQKLIEYHHNERGAALEMCCDELAELLRRGSISQEDANSVKEISKTIAQIEIEYSNLIRGTDADKYTLALKEGFLSSTPMLESLEGQWSNDSVPLSMQMVLLARRAKKLAKLTEFKVNALLSRHQPERVTRCNEILDQMREYQSKPLVKDAVLEKFDGVCEVVKEVAGEIHKQALRESSQRRANNIRSNVRAASKRLMDMAAQNDEESAAIIRELNERMRQQHEVLMVFEEKKTQLILRPGETHQSFPPPLPLREKTLCPA